MTFHYSDFEDMPVVDILHSLCDAVNAEFSSTDHPIRSNVSDVELMAMTPGDMKEYPNSYVFVVDMPGLKSSEISVWIENDNMLMMSGERKREEENVEVKYLRMERRVGKFMKMFVLPENANTDAIKAVCHDGVLSVTVEKLPPPEPKIIQVNVE